MVKFKSYFGYKNPTLVIDAKGKNSWNDIEVRSINKLSNEKPYLTKN
jgi:hypothetical protein